MFFWLRASPGEFILRKVKSIFAVRFPLKVVNEIKNDFFSFAAGKRCYKNVHDFIRITINVHVNFFFGVFVSHTVYFKLHQLRKGYFKTIFCALFSSWYRCSIPSPFHKLIMTPSDAKNKLCRRKKEADLFCSEKPVAIRILNMLLLLSAKKKINMKYCKGYWWNSRIIIRRNISDRKKKHHDYKKDESD